MNALEQLALAWQAVIRTLAQMRHPSTWVPWLGLGAIQVAVLALIWNFANPAVSAFMAPFVAWLAGEAALHYPGSFRQLPAIYATVDLAIGALLGPVAVGAATRLFADRFRGIAASPRRALAEAGRRAFALIVCQLPFHLVALGLGLGLGGWLGSHPHGFVVRTIGWCVVIGGSVLAQSMFFYAAALVVLERRSAGSALAGLPRTWARGFWAAFALGLLLLLALLPFEILQDQAGRIVSRGRPELVGALTLVQVLATLVIWCVLSGSATLVYLAAMARSDRETT